MSLHPDVQNLAAQGRNGDSMLLHVTPDEVQGLHQLALMHGTKMTINPVTGLPEANFMKDWLPVIVGGLATIATAGMATPIMIGAGALSAFGTSMGVGNSFKKSLFTGLMAGAGGALGAGLGAAGGAAAGAVGTEAAVLGGTNALTMTGEQLAAKSMQGALSRTGATALGDVAAGGTGGFANAGTGAARLAPGMFGTDALTAQAGARTQAALAQQVVKPISYSIPNPSPASLMATRQPAYVPGGSFVPEAPKVFSAGTIPPAAPQSYMGGVSDALSAQGRGVNKLFEPGEFSKFAGKNKLALAGLGIGGMGMMSSDQQKIKPATAHGDYYSYPGFTQGYDPTGGASGQQYFNYGYGTPTVTHYAEGGSIGDEVNNVMYPQSQLPTGTVGQYGNRSAVPVPREVVGAQDAVVNPFTGAEGMAAGGIATLGGYSDGGRLTQGPGDGVSDSIPASIGGKQPARLADGEFVIPARIVSEIGNGSTKAGAKKLYAMMDRIQKARRKTKDIAANTRADRFMPA